MNTSSLPSQPTSFIGREQELAEITDLLSNPDCRLLTLVGPGGIGKTRLAIEAAQRSPMFHGVYFVPLQPLISTNYILPSIVEALGLQLTPGSEPVQQLLEYLRQRSLLLVLDNFEHLLGGSHLLAEILGAAPDVRLLATSRERLNLREEWVLDVGGLPFPVSSEERDIEQYSAVVLFLQHTRRAKIWLHLNDVHRSAIVRICRAVGGLPLALELAAPWVRLLPIEEIASEIERSLDILQTTARNIEPRHQNIRAAFEPTWNRLTEDERHVFTRLSVFRGGFSHQAAEEVAGASLSVLAALVDKSLLRLGADGRYELHELLRQYAEEQLNISHEEADHTHDLHCHYYATFLNRCWSRITGSDIKQAFTEIEIDLSNIRTAWDWAIKRYHREDIENALNSLCFFYDERGRYQEGEEIFARAAAAFAGSSAEAVTIRTKIQVRQAALCHTAESSDKGETLLRNSIKILRETDAHADLAFALRRLALLLSDNNRAPSEVAEYLQNSLEIYTELDMFWDMAHTLNWLSIFYNQDYLIRGVKGAHVRGEQCAWEALKLYQRLDSHWGIAVSYLNLTDSAMWRGEYEQCKYYLEKSLSFFCEIGSFWGTSASLGMMAEATYKQGAYTEACRRAVQGLQICIDYGVSQINFYSLLDLAVLIRALLAEGHVENAHELLGVLKQQQQNAALGQKNHEAFDLLNHLETDLPIELSAAFERGQARDPDTALQDIIAHFRQRFASESSLTASQLSLSEPLTERELEILRLLAAGLSNSAIAQKLIIAVGTVKAHTSRIYAKLDVSNRVQAISEGERLGIL